MVYLAGTKNIAQMCMEHGAYTCNQSRSTNEFGDIYRRKLWIDFSFSQPAVFPSVKVGLMIMIEHYVIWLGHYI